jgi:hypothetical protein
MMSSRCDDIKAWGCRSTSITPVRRSAGSAGVADSRGAPLQAAFLSRLCQQPLRASFVPSKSAQFFIEVQINFRNRHLLFFEYFVIFSDFIAFCEHKPRESETNNSENQTKSEFAYLSFLLLPGHADGHMSTQAVTGILE